MPSFKDKLFSSKCCVNFDNNSTVDRLLNESIKIKKDNSSRDFHMRHDNSTNNDFDHCMELLRDNSAPNTRCLAKLLISQSRA